MKRLLLISFICLFNYSCGKATNSNNEALEGATIDTPIYAVVATAASDWSSGAHSVVAYNYPRGIINNLLPTGSDLRMGCNGENFYRIERFNANHITKFNITKPSTPIWQFSTDETGDTNSNPQQLIFIDENKAYLIRYSSPNVWIVNTSLDSNSSPNGFKIGSLNLSQYNNCDGSPEVATGLIVGDRLFLALQRLCNFAPNQDSYIAVFDINTNTEINTGMGEGGLKGIKLDIRNPYGKIKYHDGYIYVAGADGWLFGANSPLKGGIQKINVNDYSKSAVLASNKHIFSVEIASDEKGYFVEYDATSLGQDSKLSSFNPTTMQLLNENLATGNFQEITMDYDGFLWIADSSTFDPGIYVMNTLTDVIQEGPISTNLNPVEISFCER